jgi:hypothetical protein
MKKNCLPRVRLHQAFKKKEWYSSSQAPLGFHGIENTANAGKVKLGQRFIPDPLYHHLALRRIQVAGESAREASAKGPELDGETRRGNLRMDLPTHEETTMRLLTLIYHGVDVARSAYLGAPAGDSAKDRDGHLHPPALDVTRQVGTPDHGRVSEVDDYVVGRDVFDEIPKEHLP